MCFSPTRRKTTSGPATPPLVLLAAEILRARNRGEVHPDVDGFHRSVFFPLGLYALLTTTRDTTPGPTPSSRNSPASTLRSVGITATATTP